MSISEKYQTLTQKIAARSKEQRERLTELAIQNRTLSRQLREAAQNGQLEIVRRKHVRESIDRIRVPGLRAGKRERNHHARRR